MAKVINSTTLREDLQEILTRARRGERFTVLYRSQPVCQIVPFDPDQRLLGPLEDDPLFQAEALGCSTDGRSSEDHDAILYR